MEAVDQRATREMGSRQAGWAAGIRGGQGARNLDVGRAVKAESNSGERQHTQGLKSGLTSFLWAFICSRNLYGAFSVGSCGNESAPGPTQRKPGLGLCLCSEWSLP